MHLQRLPDETDEQYEAKLEAHGVHPHRLDRAVQEQRLYLEGRFTYPAPDSIFVFGSNQAGRHGAGAARYAFTHKGAVLGQGVGLAGNSYALPTKDYSIQTLPLHVIESYVDDFVNDAKKHPNLKFQVTCIGCGLAGLTHKEIAPMFKDAPANCFFDMLWERYLPKTVKFWGTF